MTIDPAKEQAGRRPVPRRSPERRNFARRAEPSCYGRYAWNTLIDQPCKIMSSLAATGPPSFNQSEDWYNLQLKRGLDGGTARQSG